MVQRCRVIPNVCSEAFDALYRTCGPVYVGDCSVSSTRLLLKGTEPFFLP